MSIIDVVNDAVAVPALVNDPLSILILPIAIAVTPNGEKGYISNSYLSNSISILFIQNLSQQFYPQVQWKGAKQRIYF